MASYKVAYGKRKNITSAIAEGIIPPGCIIFTEDSGEIFFYDLTRNLKIYESRTKFSSRKEAEIWVRKYDCSGQIITVNEGDRCNAYIVDYSGNLTGISSSGVSVQADFHINDPSNPAYIKNKPTSFPITFIEGLEEALASKVRIINQAIPGALMIADGSGNLEGSEITLQSIMSTLNSKVEISGDITPGSLMIFEESGKLSGSNVSLESLIDTLDKKVEISGEIATGSLTVFDETGKLKGSDVSLESLVSTLDKKVEIKDEFIEGSLMVSDGFGGLKHADATPQQIFSTLSRKVEVAGSVTPGSLMMATEEGNLQCCGITSSDLVLKSDIIAGSVTATISLESSGVYIVQIPTEVLVYPSIQVYHNGMLLVENTHYTVSSNFITLIGHTTYSGDLFTFVGYGSTVGLPGVGTNHSHINKDVLDTITQEMVDLWNSSSSIHESFVSKEELFGSDGLILPELLPTKAQENKIEGISLGGTLLPIADKLVTIPVGNLDSLGVVKSSTEPNKVFIEEDGTMSITSVDATKLQVPEGDELILVSGDSNK